MLKHIRKSCGLDGPKEKPKKASGATIEDPLDTEAAGFLYEQDWSHLQGALRATEICYSLLKRIEAFEVTVREKVPFFHFRLVSICREKNPPLLSTAFEDKAGHSGRTTESRSRC